MTSSLGDLATWVSVALTVITGVVAAFVFVGLRLRDRRQALTDLHISLQSGETAAARNTIGSLLYATRTRDRPPPLASIAAYFAHIYAIQRARNVFRTYSVRGHHLTLRNLGCANWPPGDRLETHGSPSVGISRKSPRTSCGSMTNTEPMERGRRRCIGRAEAVRRCRGPSARAACRGQPPRL